MENQLSDSDYMLLLSCIEGKHRCRRLEDFPQHIVGELRKLIAARMVCYAELDYARNRAINFFDPPMEYAPKAQEWFERLIHDHPVLNYFKSSGDGQALKISDFLDESEYHALPLYQEAYRLTGAEDQMGFGVRVRESFVLGIAFDRSERSFKEADRLLLNLVRPHIIQAYLHLEELAGHEQLHRDLQTALRENGLGIIILNERCEIAHATPGVLETLAGYLAVPTPTNKLPNKLQRWAFGQGETDPSLVLTRGHSRLIVRRIRQENRTLLLLSEENNAPTAERLAKYHLTPREIEALYWISEGKSNGEIAVILNISANTAKLHVERILAKLAVENRTAAASIFRGDTVR
jgi:DNA-binding NarL/FixJ family response regulator